MAAPSKPAPMAASGPLAQVLATLPEPGPGLHLVATPIGNLGDISLRALKTLSSADRVYCEDTRVTARIADRFGLGLRLAPYHDHNAAEMRPKILAQLEAGETIALVSDAGTPLISDPGYKLAREASGRGLKVSVVPGPSAVLAGLAMSGLPTDRFVFAGFLPPKSSARRRAIRELGDAHATLIFFEAPGRLAGTLSDLASLLGDREAAVLRELTKLHEEARRGRLGDLAAHYQAHRARGEIVVAVGPPEGVPLNGEDLDMALKEALRETRLKTAVADVAARLGLPRRTVYARALALTSADAPPTEGRE